MKINSRPGRNFSQAIMTCIAHYDIISDTCLSYFEIGMILTELWAAEFQHYQMSFFNCHQNVVKEYSHQVLLDTYPVPAKRCE